MVRTCLMGLVWHKQNTHTFEDKERHLSLLKSLLFGTLFQQARIWGFTQCLSILLFCIPLVLARVICDFLFMFRMFIIVNTMFISFNKSLITYKKKIVRSQPSLDDAVASCQLACGTQLGSFDITRHRTRFWIQCAMLQQQAAKHHEYKNENMVYAVKQSHTIS